VDIDLLRERMDRTLRGALKGTRDERETILDELVAVVQQPVGETPKPSLRL
jgi:hypothetical protein